ncbi:MAG: hypothetical protein J5737_05650 [Bacteroidales bacterium]|nr:hypothetical protein [Bacteroidales bacterium]
MKQASFIDKEAYCQYLFDSKGPFWHIATPGNLTEILFTNPDEYRFGVTLSAICAFESGLTVYALQVMSNHLHKIVGAPSPAHCRDFLGRYALRLKRFAASHGRILELPGFVCDPIPIPGIQSLRNSIVYTHRNKYVADASQTPFSYPWGSGGMYFGFDYKTLESVKFNDLTYREQRLITNSRPLVLPDSYTVRDGCIAPESFCDWQTGRSFFRDAHQYFNMLTKNYEAYAEFADLCGDSSVLTDEEMYSAACALSKKQFNSSALTQLSDSAKADLARRLHFDYRAGNNQIRRILRMDPLVIEAMFPVAR